MQFEGDEKRRVSSEADTSAAGGESPPEVTPTERKKHHHRRKRWTTIEKELRALHGPLIAGVDEVGRGPLAGPVVACAVIMPPDMRAIAGVDDSKQLTADQRVRLAVKIRERALGRLHMVPNHVLIDGKRMRTLPIPHTAVVHGDARCFSVACASIIAKVTRDHLMRRLALRHPAYTWERNVGYTTRAHIAGLASHGITRHHRRSFFRISQLAFDFDGPLTADMIIVEDIASETLLA